MTLAPTKVADLLASTAPLFRWDGRCRVFYTPEQLRAFGDSWKAIEEAAMASADAVRW